MMSEEIKGLTKEEVAQRRSVGWTNHVSNASSRSMKDIIRANVFSPFNALIAGLTVVTMFVSDSPADYLFFIAMILNAAIGVVQELYAKYKLDKLAIMVKPTAHVIRDGKVHDIKVDDIVRDDYIKLETGDQISADGKIIESEGLEVDESLLTGEADPITKNTNDTVMSGSIVVSGHAIMQATKVGAESYSAKLSSQAKEFVRASSELIEATNKIMRWIARMLIVVAPILVIGQLMINGNSWKGALLHSVAAIIGMIPEGLVLLTSTAFMLSAVNLARRKVLVQQLPAVETLARVNTLLLDKTGTITDGKIQFKELITISQDDNIGKVLSTMAGRGGSLTNIALKKEFGDEKQLKFTDEVPFSSQRKWSALLINDTGYILGAPEIVLGSGKSKALNQAKDLAAEGYRVLVLATGDWNKEKKLIGQRKALALIVLTERIRPDAKDTLQYFRQQGVKVKVISGDSPRTVGAVANQVGLDVASFDARELPDPDKNPSEFLHIIRSYNVFGRVKPEQKRQIAAALKNDGDVVAMTGDGVNDALALKKADLGIAMSSGAAATRSVAEIVLLDNKFSRLPSVVAEGRRVVANIERAANLFIIKNVYITTLALALTFCRQTYLFLPSQMTVINCLTIGVPAFFLALAPNNRRYKPGFLRRVLRFSIPTGLAMAFAMFICYDYLRGTGYTVIEASTAATILNMAMGTANLVWLAKPLDFWKGFLVFTVDIFFITCIMSQRLARVFKFQFHIGTLPMILISGILVGILVLVFSEIYNTILRHRAHKRSR